MEYYNEQEMPNYKVIKIKHLNHYKNQYKYSSTDNILENKGGNNLHKIYNKFLVNPYLIRNSRYRNALNNINKTQDNNKNINFQNIEELYEGKKDSNPNDLKNLINSDNSPTNNISSMRNNKNKNIFNTKIRNQLFNEEKKNNIYQEENINQPINSKNNLNNIDFPKIKNKNYNIIERPIEYNINYNKNYNDIYFTNNNNRLSLSYDVKNKNNINGKQYISPIIAKIAKNNYLMRNPYSDKNEYLGPSALINNPILYPISTYKFDFNRYIRNYHVNKFI